MAFYGYGYRYPKAARRTIVDYGDDYWEKWAKAAVLNKRIAKSNPWIQHLKSLGVYDQIRNLLQKAAISYRQTHGITEGRKSSLKREIEKLESARDKVKSLSTAVMQKYSTPDRPLTQTDIDAVLKDLDRQINTINQILGTQTAQPKGSGYHGYGYFY
ncbi:MAG: hypothetical protein NZZ41_07755 [Candidatus Dojkabacteria bacterium]|nr:hypothetical protein [Candidatus Dojkabacteria bacterium]